MRKLNVCLWKARKAVVNSIVTKKLMDGSDTINVLQTFQHPADKLASILISYVIG